ncbi:YfhO family protein, partial [Hymenobacter coccineus]
PAEPMHPALAKAARAAAGNAAAAPDAPETRERLRQLLYAGAVTAGVLVLAWLASFSFDFAAPVDASLVQGPQNPGGFPAPLIGALRADRADLLRNDVWRGLLFVGLALGTLYFYLKGKLGPGSAAALVALLVLVDLWSVDKRYLGEKNFQPTSIAQSFEPSAADQAVLQDKDLSYRVLNIQNPFNEAQTSYFHKSIGGYHGAKLRRYQDLVEREISPEMQALFSQNGGDFRRTPVLNMLNTRYYLTGNEKQPVIRNPGALGNAWFVRAVQTVATPDAELAAVAAGNPGRTAVVDHVKFPAVQAATYADTTATISLTTYAPDALSYGYNAAQPGTVVFSEVYYADGWNAYLDGKPTPYFRADFVLRAMNVPAGAHKIDFKFEPKEYATGNTVSLISSIGLVLVLLGAGAYVAKRQPEADAA